MTPEDRGKLIHFCTGSARVPANGFANLMGYGGEQRRFTLERATNFTLERLPVSSTCFNTLYLPPYATAQALAEKLRLVYG